MDPYGYTDGFAYDITYVHTNLDSYIYANLDTHLYAYFYSYSY